jgi:subtilisin family serine protease
VNPTYRLNSNRPVGGRAVLALMIAMVVLIPALSIRAATTEYDRTRVIVRLQSGESTQSEQIVGQSGRPDFDRLTTQFGVTRIDQLFPLPTITRTGAVSELRRGLLEFVAVTVPAGVDPDQFLNELRNSSDVVDAAFDPIVYLTGTPDDPYFSTHQYALRNTGSQPPQDPGTAGADCEMEAAWEHTTGDSSVILAILDTGLDINHPEFAGRLWINDFDPIDEVDNDSNGYVDDRFGWNFINENNSPNDDNMHGTHVTGIAAATGGNGDGVAGMDWNCRIMPLKVIAADGSGGASIIAAGIVYAVDMGADIISMSLGTYGLSGALEAATAYADTAGVIVVAAMGNDNIGDPLYPAAYPSTIAVGATDSDDNRAWPLCSSPGSNFGPWIDLCAPGNYVWNTVPRGLGGYANLCGTSMATPHVSGLASLILSLRPDYPADSVRRILCLGAEDAVGRLTEDTPGYDDFHGWGRINGRITLQALAVAFAPNLTVPGPQATTEADTMSFAVSAFDSNFTTPTLSIVPLANAAITDHGDGTATFSFTPDYTQAGQQILVFVASDGALADSQTVLIDVAPSCLCDCLGDPQCDGVTNVLDVVQTVDVAFRGGAASVDASCDPHPAGRTDVNCDDVTNVLDVVAIVNVAFRSQAPNFCTPCTP